MASVQLTGISRRYSNHVAADGINLSIEEGEFVALVGPSGCGKSTLLRLIAGLDQPDTGTIRIGSQEVNALEPAKRNVAMVFQNYALYPHLTIRQNITTPLRLRQLDRWERLPLLWRLSAASRARRTAIDRRVREAADMLGIGALLERKPAALSGGQRQRVALGRAIVRQPAVFLYDEPLSNLDTELRASMRGEIVALHKRLGVATVYVTHDQVEAMTMADRIAVMRAGRILQVGTPGQLYTRPDSIEVARTLGTPCIGLLPATVTTAAGGVCVAGAAVWPIDPDLPEGSELTIGLRAEYLRFAEAGAEGALPARVISVEYLGAETLVYIEINPGFPSGGGAPGRLAVRGGDRLVRVPHVGEQINIAADFTRIVVFDKRGHRVSHVVRGNHG